MGVHKLCVELRSADPQDDPEVIRGVLRELFNKMPQGMRAMKIADQLYANDMACAHTLARPARCLLQWQYNVIFYNVMGLVVLV